MDTSVLKVLIVEDNAADARLIQLFLRERPGAESRHASTLREALAIVATGWPDVVLLDLGLPDGESLNTLRGFNSGEDSGIPVIVLTGLDDDSVATQALREGAQDYLVKGRIDAELLARTISYAIERKRAAEALRRSEGRLRRIVDSDMVGVFFWSHDGRILDANPLFHKLLGYEPGDAAMGRLSWTRLTPPEWHAIDELQTLEIQARHVVKPYEKEFFRRDGSRLPVLISAATFAPDHEEGVCFVVDLTEQKRSERALRHSEALLRLSHRAAGSGAWDWDLINGRMTWSEETYELLGINPQTPVTYEAWLGRVHPDDREAADWNFCRAVAQGLNLDAEFRILRDNGEVCWVGAMGRVIREGSGLDTATPDPALPISTADKGRPVRMVGIVVDITQRKRVELALKNSEEQLRHAQKLEAVGMLASGVAHDFNNLLTAIRGYTSLARARLSHDHLALDAMEHVELASRQAAGVASALLTFARRGTPEMRPVEAVGPVESAVRLFRRTLAPNIRLFADIERARDLWVSADATQLQQVVMNLAINARDAINSRYQPPADPQGLTNPPANPPANPPEGEINITLEADPADPEPNLRLIVRDNGSGIAPDIRSRIFEPFFTTKPRGQGTGLGLPVIHSIVADHNGSIEFETAYGQGTTFIVRFPIIPAGTAEPNPSPEFNPELNADAPARGGTALLAESNTLVRGLLASMLSTLGYIVTHAANGPDAIARCSDKHFDLLVVDHDLSGLNGIDVLTRLRSKGITTHSVVVAPATAPDIDIPGAALLRKPFQLADLRRAIAELLTTDSIHTEASPNGARSSSS